MTFRMMFHKLLTAVARSPCLVSRSLSAAASPPAGVWSLGKLNHVAIAVPDLAAATSLYRDMLGATVSPPQVLYIFFTLPFKGEPKPHSPFQDLPEHGVTTVFVELSNTKLELLHPLGAKSPIAGFLEKNKTGGIHHVCIEVNDINAAVADVKSKNIRCLSPEPRIGAHGKPVMFLHPKDCNGVLVELEQE